MSTQLSLIDEPSYPDTYFPPARGFQDRALNSVVEGRRAGHRKQLICAPTGAGKSYLGLRLCQKTLAKGMRAMFVCDRTVLINQTSATAKRYGLGEHGIIQADNPGYNPNLPFQIASAQTLGARGWPVGHLVPDLIVVDEAHTQLSAWVDYVAQTQSTVIGLSATPFSKGLGKIFSNLINAATMDELTREDVLVPLQVFSCTKANMDGAATSGGEWTDTAAEERGMEIVGDVVKEWSRYGEGRKTICFGSTIKHCEELCSQFVRAGIMAALYTGKTPDVERQRLLREFEKPDSEIRILISVEALAKGFDVPDVGCIIDCRPLRKSLSTFVQIIGRGLRSSPSTGKVDCILLDHSGNIIRFREDFEKLFFDGVLSLNDGEKLDSEIRKEPTDERPVGKCPACGFSPFAKRCMACGYEHVKPDTVVHEAGEMVKVELKKGGEKIDRESLYWQCVAYARKNSAPENQRGRAAHLYKSFAGDWPPFEFRMDNVPHDIEITKPFMNAVIAQNIRRNKAKQKAAA